MVYTILNQPFNTDCIEAMLCPTPSLSLPGTEVKFLSWASRVRCTFPYSVSALTSLVLFNPGSFHHALGPQQAHYSYRAFAHASPSARMYFLTSEKLLFRYQRAGENAPACNWNSCSSLFSFYCTYNICTYLWDIHNICMCMWHGLFMVYTVQYMYPVCTVPVRVIGVSPPSFSSCFNLWTALF